MLLKRCPRRFYSKSVEPPKLPSCDFVPESYSGPSYEEATRIKKENVVPSQKSHFKNPLLIHQGYKQWLFDHTGKRYLDMFAGIVTVSVGHSHPSLNQVLKEQSSRLWHTTCIYMHPRIFEYAQALTSKFPGDLKVAYFVNSGSEANDLALLLARSYSGNNDIIALRNSYHGGSTSTMSITGNSNWRFPYFNNNIHFAKNPDVYKGSYGGKHCRDSPVQTQRCCDCKDDECCAGNAYVDDIREIIKFCSPKGKIAGFFAESIQGVGGTVQYPKNYLKKAYEIVRESGGVCIADEVQTGFGRTGSNFWGFQNHGVVPDIVTMAKGIGNGFPLAAVVTTPKIASCLTKALHFNTFGGNPLASSVGLQVLKVIEKEGLQENSKTVGTYLLQKLKCLRDKHEIVGDVRGKGLMIGVELVTDKETKNPLPSSTFGEIWEACKDLGLLVGAGGVDGNVFRIKPPMCITKEDADFTYSVLDVAISNSIRNK